jgi:uncharacterized protein YbjT (DUF2867 family)
MTILVVGATGVLGRQVVARLRECGEPVRALVRDPARATDLAAAGVEVIIGDLVDPDSLERACAGVERVLAAAHALLGRGRHASEHVDDAGHRALIAAARAAGVRRFVYVSAHGASPDHPVDFFRTKHAIEQVLKKSGLDAVILRPTAFMEQHVHEFIGKAVLARGKAQLIGPGTKARNFVAAADVAGFAVRALLEDPPRMRDLTIGSPGHYSNAEVAALYAQEAGLTPRASHLPAGLAAALSKIARPLHPGVARLLHMVSLPDDAFSEYFHGADALARDHGVRLTTVPEFIAARVRAARED